MPDYCLNLLSNRDKSSICSTARRLGLQCVRLWSEDEVKFLIENYSKLGGKNCAERLNRPYASVRTKAKKLNLVACNLWSDDEIILLKENYYKGAQYCSKIIERSPEVIRVKASQLWLTRNRSERWSTAELDFLSNNYTQHGAKFCADVLTNRTKQSIIRKANKLGLNRQK